MFCIYTVVLVVVIFMQSVQNTLYILNQNSCDPLMDTAGGFIVFN